MSENVFHQLIHNLKEYKKKYYQNQLIRGLIFFIAAGLSTYLIFSSLEYFLRFGSIIRGIFLFSFLAIVTTGLYRWLFVPIWKLTHLNESLSDEEASLMVGRHFPEIKDKLLNTLQLRRLNQGDNELLIASIEQRSKALSVVPFVKAVNFGENKKYYKYIIAPGAIMLLLLLFIPQLFTEGTERIFKFNTTFAEPAPFQFVLQNSRLDAYRNEDLEIKVTLTGEAIPDHIYLVHQGRQIKMVKNEDQSYSYFFRNLQKEESFYLEAAGYSSDEYQLKLLSRPDLKDFDVVLHYPEYLHKKPEELSNAGNLIVPEGTQIEWNFRTVDAERMQVQFNQEQNLELEKDGNSFLLKRRSTKSEEYSLKMFHGKTPGKEQIRYSIQVIPDQFPGINVEVYKDTVLYNYLTLGGTLSDDYGLTRLVMHYRLKEKENTESTWSHKPIRIEPGITQQTFLYSWKLDTLNLVPGQYLEYYLEVWDNDGVHGAKSTKSRNFTYKMPSERELQEEMDKSVEQTEKRLEQLLKESSQLQKDMENFQQKIRTKSTLNWQDKKTLEEMLNKQQMLEQQMQELNRDFDQLTDKQEKFNNQSEELKEKLAELQKLMDEMLTPEMQEYYEQLRKMLEQNARKEDVQKLLEEMEKDQEKFEQNVDRTLELFKQAQFEQKSENIQKDLDQLSKDQEQLAEQNEKGELSKEELSQKQEELNQRFEDVKKDMEELRQMNEQLEEKNDMPDTQETEQQIDQEQQNSSDQIQKGQKGQNSKSAQSQKNAAQKMKEMKQDMEQSMEDNRMETLSENMESLRQILENLIKLSYDQEALMKEFRNVNQNDPRYQVLTQKQLELEAQARIIEDSLIALSKRAFMLRSFVMNELSNMNENMDKSMDLIKIRRPDLAVGTMQMAMTSMNNLALLMSDILEQMQQQMASMMQQQQQNKPGGQGQCNKPGSGQPKPGNKGKPNLGDISKWQQSLNQRMEQLMKSGQTGKGFSEQVAQMAAEQEMIRRALAEYEKMMQQQGMQPSNEMNTLKQQMEKNETDLVNKRLTQETIMRNRDIMTRLLETEKSIREREQDPTRQATTAQQRQNEIPPSFEKYLKAKEQQVDLLKTLPPSLTPYFKEEVNEYFQKIEK